MKSWTGSSILISTSAIYFTYASSLDLLHFYYHRYLFVHRDLCTKTFKESRKFWTFFILFIYLFTFYTAFKSSGGFQLAENVKFDLFVYFPSWLYIVQWGRYRPTFKLNLHKYSDSFTKEFLPNAGYTGIYPPRLWRAVNSWRVSHDSNFTKKVLKHCTCANEVASRTTIRYQC